jgi:TAG lipase/steryl ester hydrolase/phospholipase A2/LPA acyltransferase
MNDTEHFRECCRTNIGNFTFQEAFDRTGRIMNITGTSFALFCHFVRRYHATTNLCHLEYACCLVTPNNSSDPPRLLNYLTAPHVLVWSAAVASSSLPGVFEANRLMVKDADGTFRYESAEGAKFSDGSMEQDLPMQQLSEMFNVNHFIVSQGAFFTISVNMMFRYFPFIYSNIACSAANPHAVMFASYNQNQSIWTNPITGMITAVLTFLKDRCRSFIAHVVELVGARRIAPIHATSRGMMTQFFTQEYEGRDCDISLIPWLSHRSAASALMHALYNPTLDECREWIAAAERETWKHIPAIKSHIAEEVTLDRCVQRLRQRVIVESWEKRRQDSTGQKMGERVPSFFMSPSLINLGGLNVSDQSKIEDFEEYNHDEASSRMAIREDPHVPPLGMSSGWGGHGLRGNRSTVSLEESASSGIFIDGEDQPSVSHQVPGEQSLPTPTQTNRAAANSNISDSIGNNGYIKTTSMAHFYYRKTGSYGDLPRRSKSHDHVDRTSEESDCY